jgi:hypothetical protein
MRMIGRLLAIVTLVALLEQVGAMAQAPPRRGGRIGLLAGRQFRPQPPVRTCDQARSALNADLSFAPPVLINFEDISRADLVNQYAGKGVTFNGPTVIDHSQSTGIGGFAHSPTHGIEQCYAKEFCNVPIEMRFAEPQARVQLWVGYSGRAQKAGAIWLETLDAAGQPIDRCAVTVTPTNTPHAIALPLELATASNMIATARVAAPELGITSVAMDDLEFQRLAPRVPDLVIRSAKGTVPASGPARIRIVVAVNDAPSPATKLTVDSPAWGTLSADVRALDPAEEGAEIEVSLPADLASGRHRFVVKLESPPGVAESNLDNNVFMDEIDVPARSTSSNASQPSASNARDNDRQVTPRGDGGPGGRLNVVLWIIGGVLVLSALGFIIGRTRTPKPPRTPRSKRAQQPSADRIHVTPHADAGRQRITPARGLPAFVVRVRPVAGPSSIHVHGGSPGE